MGNIEFVRNAEGNIIGVTIDHQLLTRGHIDISGAEMPSMYLQPSPEYVQMRREIIAVLSRTGVSEAEIAAGVDAIFQSYSSQLEFSTKQMCIAQTRRYAKLQALRDTKSDSDAITPPQKSD